ncbi:MAG: putative toxin-antitoxin system toxin component, PIN family [Clostridiales bacterium]|jgi:putative PIN family toxin of toxin-antitoxin system|nr:putative toxin-antitoxin system toxin component, PIN family [Clostridiales bacterium]
MSDTRLAALDTNSLVPALLPEEGNPAKMWKRFLTGALSLVFNVDIFEEYQDVLHRSRLRIPPEDTETVLAAIRQHGEIVESLPNTAAMVDEDDSVFYDTAKSARAYLITGNMKHYPQEPFILTPAEFLKLYPQL